MIAEIAGLFGSRLVPRRGRTSVRRRRPAGRGIAIELLEPRRVLDADTGWIKIDLTDLDATGSGKEIYFQGSANASEQILQYDLSLATPGGGKGGWVFTTPLPSPVTFSPGSATGDYTPVPGHPKSITLSTAAQLFVGESVTFKDNTTSRIASISATVTAGSWDGTTWIPAPLVNLWRKGDSVAIQSAGTVNNGSLTDDTLSGSNVGVVANSGMSIGSLVVGNPVPLFAGPFPTPGQPAQVTTMSVEGVNSAFTVTTVFSESSGFTTADKLGGSNFLTVFSGGTSSGFATYDSAAATPTVVPTTQGGGFVQQVTVGNLLSTSQVKQTEFSLNSTDRSKSLNNPESYLMLQNVSGNFQIFTVDSYTITFVDDVPANASVTFETAVAATATSNKTFTIDASSTGIQGVIAGLSLGLQPTLSQNSSSSSAAQISGLSIDLTTNLITVTLSKDMSWSTGAMTLALPPTGGFLPPAKWSATGTSNAIWARQTSNGSTSDTKISVNGSRIYFSLVEPGERAPQMAYSTGAGGLSVAQFKPEDIWNGTVPLSQYVELTANALAGGAGQSDGNVFVDLSAVDGFFFPAELSTKVNGNELVIGQTSTTYKPPVTATTGPTTYSAVSRQEILNAYDDFFTDSSPTSQFAPGATALQQAYAALHVKSGVASIGIQNPTFMNWATTPESTAATTLNAAWNNDLDALFRTSANQVDLLGDKDSTAWQIVNAIAVTTQGSQGSGYKVDDLITFTTPLGGGRAATARVTHVQPSTASNPGGIVQVHITDPGLYPNGETPTFVISGSGTGANPTVEAMIPAKTFYRGVPTAGTGTNPNKLVLTEYVGQTVISPTTGTYAPPPGFEYANLYPTGVVFTVFDPRTVPTTEAQASNVAVGEQILGNFGVFASSAITTENYQASTLGTWSKDDALKQLLALQRDIVSALNQGNGGISRGSGDASQPGSTTAYWTNEKNWYPYPQISSDGKYQLQTPQNLYSQWVHTAGSVDGPAIGQDKYFATYPFGDTYGQPTQAWGSTGAGSGPLMNQTYGFAYDEAPAHGIAGANVPSKFLPITNSASPSPLTFKLVFGPWSDPAPSVESIDTNPPQTGSTPLIATSKTLSWTVTFSEAVSGVTASNFNPVTIVTDGAPALGGLTVTPSGAAPTKTWTVTGTISGTGSASVSVNLGNNNGITDSANQPLSTTSFTGQTYGVLVPIVTGLNKTQGSVNGGTDVTISGAGFNATSTVMFGSVPAANVRYQPASGGQAAVLIIASPPQTAGSVDITVMTGQSTSASAAAPKFIYVSTAQPIVHPSSTVIAADAGTLTILGEHFSSSRAGNAVTLSSGTAIVQSVTATSITLLFTSRPTGGLLTATVKVGRASSGAVQVAAVYATVTPAMASLAATAKTLVIMGTGFDTKTPAKNVVTLSSGAGVVTKATATALTISLTTAPQIGPLSVTALRVRGVETLGLPVEVATVVPGPASAKSKMTTIAAQATVGDPVAVTMQGIDALGNLATTGGAKVRFAASAAGTFSKVTDNGDGTYTASFTTKRVGAQIYYATANGVKVTETATTVYFIAQFTHPIPGADWLVKRGGFVAAPFAVIATAATNNVAIYKGASARNVTVSSNVGNLDDGQFGGVVARYSSKTSYYQAGLMLEAGQYYAVIQAVGLTGVRTLAKQLVAGAGEGYVSFRVNGSSLSLTLNGSQVAEVTDTRLKSGRVGMSGGQAVRFANFNAG